MHLKYRNQGNLVQRCLATHVYVEGKKWWNEKSLSSKSKICMCIEGVKIRQKGARGENMGKTWENMLRGRIMGKNVVSGSIY
jgi:hypothetical protein